LAGADVPVFMGAEKPLHRAHESAHWFHGRDGLGDHGYPLPRKSPEKKHASEAIMFNDRSQPCLVLVTWDLFRILLCFTRNPGIAAKVALVVMGGAPCARAT